MIVKSRVSLHSIVFTVVMSISQCNCSAQFGDGCNPNTVQILYPGRESYEFLFCDKYQKRYLSQRCTPYADTKFDFVQQKCVADPTVVVLNNNIQTTTITTSKNNKNSIAFLVYAPPTVDTISNSSTNYIYYSENTENNNGLSDWNDNLNDSVSYFLPQFKSKSSDIGMKNESIITSSARMIQNDNADQYNYSAADGDSDDQETIEDEIDKSPDVLSSAKEWKPTPAINDKILGTSKAENIDKASTNLLVFPREEHAKKIQYKASRRNLQAARFKETNRIDTVRAQLYLGDENWMVHPAYISPIGEQSSTVASNSKNTEPYFMRPMTFKKNVSAGIDEGGYVNMVRIHMPARSRNTTGVGGVVDSALAKRADRMEVGRPLPGEVEARRQTSNEPNIVDKCPGNERQFLVEKHLVDTATEPLTCNVNESYGSCPPGFYCHAPPRSTAQNDHSWTTTGICCGRTDYCGGDGNSAALIHPSSGKPVRCDATLPRGGAAQRGCPDVFFCRPSANVCCTYNPMAGFCEQGRGLIDENGDTSMCTAHSTKSSCPDGYRCQPRFNSTLCCPTKENVCRQAVHSGLKCVGSPPQSVYYYDARHGACHRFDYSGCGGNDNRFESAAECRDYCSSIRLPQSTKWTADNPIREEKSLIVLKPATWAARKNLSIDREELIVLDDKKIMINNKRGFSDKNEDSSKLIRKPMQRIQLHVNEFTEKNKPSEDSELIDPIHSGDSRNQKGENNESDNIITSSPEPSAVKWRAQRTRLAAGWAELCPGHGDMLIKSLVRPAEPIYCRPADGAKNACIQYGALCAYSPFYERYICCAV